MNELSKKDDFKIYPVEESVLTDKSVKIDLGSSTAVQAFLHEIPNIASQKSPKDMYVLRFPSGVAGSLMNYKAGGQGTPIQDVTGSVVGHASLHEVSATMNAMYSTFMLMSIASSQYYLHQINKELKMMKLSIDKILEFLYGDKKAELMAEFMFVKYVYQNYEPIMLHDTQRIATISSLQQSRKIAMKDIEFYMNDMDYIVRSKDHISKMVPKIQQIKESLDLSIQLYGMSTVLESYIAQNHTPSYINYISDDMTTYIDKCEKRLLSCYSMLHQNILKFKPHPLEKVDVASYTKDVSEVIESLNQGGESENRKLFKGLLDIPNTTTEYFVKGDEMYLL